MSVRAEELLSAARRLVDTQASNTTGVWARAAALLTRQALELTVGEMLDAAAPGSRATPFHTQFLVLRALHQRDDLAARAAYVWVALSQATHHQGYELPPTSEALRGWIAAVEEFVAGRAGTRHACRDSSTPLSLPRR